MTSLYSLLGVSRDATAAEIKAAYRRLAKSNHPDVVGSDGSLMAAINEAYEVLIDSDKRAEYDSTGDVPSNTRSIERQAEECLAQLFGKYFDEEGDVEGDLTKRLLQMVAGIHVQQQTAIGKLKQQILAIERKMRRLAKKGAGHDLFKAVAEQKLRDRKQDLAKTEIELAVAARVIELAKEYSDTGVLPSQYIITMTSNL